MAVEQQPLPEATPSETIGKGSLSEMEIVDILNNYRTEADLARRSGPNGRDDVWEANVALYWNQFDFSKKASWQSREVMPEAPMFVDRWSSSMREALVITDAWYQVQAPGDSEGDIAQAIKKFTDVWLARCGRNVDGQPVEFGAVFENLMKLSAMMAATATVTWKRDDEGRGYVAIEVVDPREVLLDATGRGLYRIRRLTVDMFRLKEMAKLKDERGKAIFNIPEIERLESALHDEDEVAKSRLAGHGVEISTPRKPIVIDEYLCTLIDKQGNKVESNVLCVVANERFLIRGPEKNPLWHKRDWLLYASAVSVPLSVYGRTYMESWSSVARTFIELTNLILDATFTQAMKVFTIAIDMLEDPTQLDDGIHPNLALQVSGGSAKDVMNAVDMGSLSSSVVTVWQGLKQELREGAAFSEIALGQIPPKGDITATEISASEQSSSALLRSIARSVEVRLLEPMLNLVWKTGMQHMDEDDEELQAALGPEMFQMFLARRRELVGRRITFRATGISSLIDRTQKLRALLSAIQIFSQNEILAKIFFSEQVDPRKLAEEVLSLLGIDTLKLRPTAREAQVSGILENTQQQREVQAEQQKADPLAGLGAA